MVGRAAAVAEGQSAAAGWELLRTIPAEAVEGYQPYWALAAHLLWRLDRRDEARAAAGRAMGLCEDPAVRAFLAQRTL
jgi:RNA polymerase sigma-70 factor (ECF subfamily)